MKYIREYQVFESEPIRTVFTKEQLNWLDKCVKGSWKYNPQTGLVDVVGDFNCSNQNLQDFKGVKFGKVSGSFEYHFNRLTSLVGAPHSVGVNFFCNDNELTTLEGAPHSVGVDFFCDNNQLTTLEGAPKTVGGGFYCNDNELTTLEGAPQSVGKNFYCGSNQLTSLKGAPHSVGADFDCGWNQLTSLIGAPHSVGRNFYCFENELTSLEGAPKTVGAGFRCSDNTVSESTLKGIFDLMKKGNSYQQALEEYWPEMGDEDRVLMYKDKNHSSLSPEDARKYKAMTTYSNIKGYL
jgi:hypothetical protein